MCTYDFRYIPHMLTKSTFLLQTYIDSTCIQCTTIKENKCKKTPVFMLLNILNDKVHFISDMCISELTLSYFIRKQNK